MFLANEDPFWWAEIIMAGALAVAILSSILAFVFCEGDPPLDDTDPPCSDGANNE